MKRLILGLAACAFLLLVGVQAGHHHRSAELKSCAVCVLGAQTVPHLPTALSAGAVSRTQVLLIETASPRESSFSLWAGPARAPPSV